MCWKCKADIEIENIARTSECPACGADLHCCRNCRFYSEGSHFDCKENVEENITDKERSNFCDAFSVRQKFNSSGTEMKTAEEKRAAAKNAFDALFSI